MSLSDLTDAELLLLWRAGNVAAGSELVRRHHPRIRRVFGISGCNADWVADRVQQTFLIFCEQRDRILDPNRVRSYLLGIANNLLREHFKNKYRPGGGPPADEDADDLVDPEAPGFSTLFSNEQERNRVNNALARMPLQSQLILQHRYWDDLPYQEIADILKIPLGTVASRLKNARVRLERELQRNPRPGSSKH